MYTKWFIQPLRLFVGGLEKWFAEVYTTMAITRHFFRRKKLKLKHRTIVQAKHSRISHTKWLCQCRTFFSPWESLLMANMTTSPYKTDDPAYGHAAKTLFLAQFWASMRSETQTLGWGQTDSILSKTWRSVCCVFSRDAFWRYVFSPGDTTNCGSFAT